MVVLAVGRAGRQTGKQAGKQASWWEGGQADGQAVR